MAFVERGLVVGRNAWQIAAYQRNVMLIDDVRKERPMQSGHVDDTEELLRGRDPVRFRALRCEAFASGTARGAQDNCKLLTHC